jgi:hypothetical protein
MIIPSFAYLVLLGAVPIIIQSLRDFHEPYTISDVRYAVLRERYLMSLSLYAGIWIVFYLIVLYGVLSVFKYVLHQRDATLESIALLLSVSITVCVPKLSFSSRALNWLRRVAQRFARFPDSAQKVSALIARAHFRVGAEMRLELSRELTGYGVPSGPVAAALADDNELISRSAKRLLEEVSSFHLGFGRLEENKEFARFWSARYQAILALDKAYYRLMRRVARAVHLVSDLREDGALHLNQKGYEEIVVAVSDFIVEESEPIRTRYRRLLAEAVLSCLPAPSVRSSYVGRFGYDIELPNVLPIVPFALVFLSDFLISVVPTLVGAVSAGAAMQPYSAFILGFLHASALTCAIFLAVYPKIVGTFARPSLFTLPWKSYFFFGTLSFLVGAGTMYVGLDGRALLSVGLGVEIPPAFFAAKHPLIASILFSIIFFVITVSVSIAVDYRLRDNLRDYNKNRVRDGIVMALLFSVTLGITQLQRLPVDLNQDGFRRAG